MKQGEREGGKEIDKKEGSDHFLPGRAAVYVKTWGCGHNNSDGEYMAGLLAANGYTVLLQDSQKNDADVWLLNSCTVKGPSEQTFINDIRKGQDQGKRVVVAGCVPQASQNRDEWAQLSVIGVQQIDAVVDVVEETLKGNTVRMMRDARTTKESGTGKRKDGGARLDMPKVRRNPFIEIIPINTGCLNQCTYCKTKHARGDLGSYTPDEIIARVISVMSEGVLEIWLTSEDTGAYGRDIDVSIVDLLKGIVAAMDAHPTNSRAMLRIGMTNPPYILEHIHGISQILSHPRVYAFLHVPVQAASNRVLEDMRRMYTVEEFKSVVDVLRREVAGGCTIATDVICGFPTETEDDFEETLDLVREYQFPVLHISQFYPRPGTPAARLPRLSTEIIKARSRRLTTLFNSYTTHPQTLLNTTHTVLITDRSADGNYLVGHTKTYQQVLVPIADAQLGVSVTVTIAEVGKWFLKAGSVERDVQRETGGEVGVVAAPLLVRKGREIVKLGGETQGSASPSSSSTDPSSTHPSSSSDGTILSLGTQPSVYVKPAPGQPPPIQKSSMIPLIACSVILMAILGILVAYDFRASVVVAVLGLGGGVLFEASQAGW
ncbi:hypothetical protein DFS34DRAFT_582746 [Phlyctochytrium arcticum]|nr:hypothetical protein DFS34DRAFT_582746 [Phlyctochytrium arcticum]